MNTSLINREGALQAPQLDYFLVDGSGSMIDKWWDFLATLDQFTDTMRAEGVGSHGIVSVFDSNVLDDTQRDCPIGEWPKFVDQPLAAHWGSTPLYDAINVMGRALNEIQPQRARIVIVTDGGENGSRYTTDQEARAILDWCRAQGWQVTFIGCDFNNSKQARLLGADDANSLSIAREKLTDAGKLLGRKSVNHARGGDDINFTGDEKTTFGGYLAAPESTGK
jgi:hypothetical protein